MFSTAHTRAVLNMNFRGRHERTLDLNELLFWGGGRVNTLTQRYVLVLFKALCIKGGASFPVR